MESTNQRNGVGGGSEQNHEEERGEWLQLQARGREKRVVVVAACKQGIEKRVAAVVGEGRRGGVVMVA